MVVDETCDRYQVEKIVETIFKQLHDSWNGVPGGSPWNKWYLKNANGPDAIKVTDSERKQQGVQGRLIAWKTGKPFVPSSLFFRTIDTAKLLPMHLADFNIQMYAHPSTWQWADDPRVVRGRTWTRKDWQTFTLVGMMQELLLLRNMHDRGGGDIPIIIVDWEPEFLAQALDYWVRLSKGEWTEEQRNLEYVKIERTLCRRARPCFPQADLLVRALLQDPAVGYVPPFIVFHPITFKGRATALFTSPANRPPQAFIDSFPTACSTPQCEETECGFFNLKACRSLAKDSKMVRKSIWPTGLVACNVWTCDVQHAPNVAKPTFLQRCQRCKEALYCSPSHQVRFIGIEKLSSYG
ncbi:hypothetical protein H0H81_008466 [Sphagnurus paluster]|uniref:MYND-type domain-containing protein n=1 Tax=Sphagnurus paluster TaxID=117069 RepID=A0A9P7KJ07_9AGAR|nr:hypothetical protein H0H81_008466 [Sphagnurus paluster]